jgi:3-oxoacyl-[acyl-carrier-protein] synthase-3
MAKLEFENIGVKAMAGAVPANKIDNYKFTEFFDEYAVKDVVDKVGVYERRIAAPELTASDLCFAAAEKLFEDNEILKESIDVLLFVSQTADYRMPATAIILQDRLGLPNSTLAFDVNLGCSGFVYGLSMAYAYLQQPGIRNVLLLDGETRTKAYSFKDRTTGFIFGDAGVAALITKDEKFGKSYFSLNSDGGRHELIKIDAGGYRNPSTSDTVKEEVKDDYGNIRSDEHGYMNGPDVFNFVLREIPKDIKSTLTQAGEDKEEIDFFIFHQANAFMNDYLKKKLKLPTEKVPATIHKFGNTSSVSIPITIVSELQKELKTRKKLLLCGFGVGLSWATAILNVDNCKISDIVEV